MLAQSNSAKQSEKAITLGNRTFERVASLDPKRDDSGRIKEFRPKPPPTCAEPHKYGHGPFCKFHIRDVGRLTGLYALVVDREVKYIGQCNDLVKLVNTGYGTISSANLCKKAGTSTNCKLNMKVLEITKAGGQVDQYFYPYARPKEDRLELKMQLIYEYSPAWNG